MENMLTKKYKDKKHFSKSSWWMGGDNIPVPDSDWNVLRQLQLFVTIGVTI